MDERELKESIIKLQKSVTRIEDALLGDEFNEDGVISRLNKIAVKVDLHDNYFKVLIALFVVIGFIIGVVTDFIKIL